MVVPYGDKRTGLDVDERRRHLACDRRAVDLKNREIELAADRRNVAGRKNNVLAHYPETLRSLVDAPFPPAAHQEQKDAKQKSPTRYGFRQGDGAARGVPQASFWNKNGMSPLML